MDSVSAEILIYLLAGFFVQVIVGGIPLGIIFGLLSWKLPLGGLRGWAVFSVLLLVFGCLGNLLWLAITWRKLYISADRVVDFFPFLPFGQLVLNHEFAGKTWTTAQRRNSVAASTALGGDRAANLGGNHRRHDVGCALLFLDAAGLRHPIGE